MMVNLKQKFNNLFKTDMGRKTLDNVFTIEWAGQEKKTVLIPSRSSDEYMRGRVDEEDDREERMALTNSGTVDRRTRRRS